VSTAPRPADWLSHPWRDASKESFPDRHSTPPVPVPLCRRPIPALLDCLPMSSSSIGQDERQGAELAARAPSFLGRGHPFLCANHLAPRGIAPSPTFFPTYLLSAPTPPTAKVVSTATAGPLLPVLHRRAATALLTTSLPPSTGLCSSPRCSAAHGTGLDAAVAGKSPVSPPPPNRSPVFSTPR
jgi:hypothetical protein